MNFVAELTPSEKKDVATYRLEGATLEQAVIQVFQDRNPPKLRAPKMHELEKLIKEAIEGPTEYMGSYGALNGTSKEENEKEARRAIQGQEARKPSKDSV